MPMSSRNKEHTLLFSPKARQDFVDILRYTGENWGEIQLFSYRDKIESALERIRLFPNIGFGKSTVPSPYLSYIVGSHIIIYRVSKNSISIVRILHQRMCPKKNL